MRVNPRIVAKAKLVAADRGISLVAYLSGLLEKPVERDFRALVKDTSVDPKESETGEDDKD